MTIDKDAKYDRQLRLWASTGQSNLESSHICLINASSTGCEILKNLILPGIGSFTIIDDKKVSNLDLSSNFFIKNNEINRNLATVTTKNLNELNTEVKGFAIEKSIQDLLIEENDEIFWQQFSVVIISDYTPKLNQLIDILWSKQIPLMIVNTVGFYSSFNLLTSETTVIETHDPSKLYDLRIDLPWEELQQFADSFDLDNLDDQEHAHVPCIIIFIKALQSWIKTHEGQPPWVSYTEKKNFKKYVELLSRNIVLENNFAEAVSSSHRAFQITDLPDSVKQLLKISKENPVTKNSSIFWIYIAALSKFLQLNNDVLPLPGTIPDLASDTKNYIDLQNIYKEKAKKDQKLFTEQVESVLESIGRSKDEINNDSIASFCKNSRLLFVTIGSKKFISSHFIEQFNHEKDQSKIKKYLIYFGILTFNIFINEHNRLPELSDLKEFIQLYNEKIDSTTLAGSDVKVFEELLSHNTRNYTNLNSLMGGVVSQEVLKLCTGQYVPIDNLFVFDGIESSSEKFKIEY
ncbi:unnamed protein product [Candida verbasci]|uniref:NEDD8-activating enzyme E1 regulatory subunit n=1 Tax=Candida verbasci TaxID=1227364 RepID=A0A9W4XI52_9ASCO|nr:unnamed protein product [Candida verbasci]